MVADSFGKVTAAKMLQRSLATAALVENYRCYERQRQRLGVEDRGQLLSNENSATR
jgi:hypothetical protein